MSEQINELAAALGKVQSTIKPVAFDRDNPFFKSRYATLAAVIDAIREPFAANGLSFSQPCRFEEGGRIGVETIIMHSSGQYLIGEISSTPVKNDPQAIGSLISYLKRYLLQAMVGVASREEDDDANSATFTEPPPAKAEPRTSDKARSPFAGVKL
jgi:hypothetical protein